FDFGEFIQVSPCVSRCTMHLGHASERIRILHAATIDVTLHNGGVFQQFTEALCHGAVSIVRTQFVQAFVERSLGAGERFETHCSDDVCSVEAVAHALHSLHSVCE